MTNSQGRTRTRPEDTQAAEEIACCAVSWTSRPRRTRRIARSSRVRRPTAAGRNVSENGGGGGRVALDCRQLAQQEEASKADQPAGVNSNTGTCTENETALLSSEEEKAAAETQRQLETEVAEAMAVALASVLAKQEEAAALLRAQAEAAVTQSHQGGGERGQ